MPSQAVTDSFKRIEDIIREIETHIPSGSSSLIEIRSDIAGLLLILIVSSYENCIKSAIIEYATRRHKDFGNFATLQYDKLSTKIDISDLKKYAKYCGPKAYENFEHTLSKSERRIKVFSRNDLKFTYSEILKSRHNFAHTGKRGATVEEIIKQHRIAKFIILSFDLALNF